MPRTVLDVTRLLTRAAHPIATGVDRVELAYARRALAQPEGRAGFCAIVGQTAAPLPFSRVAAFVGALDAKWRRGGGSQAAANALAGRLGASFAAEAPAPGGTDDAARLALRLRLDAVAAMRRPAIASGETYVHVSHIRLDRPAIFEALKQKGARIAMLIHDLIPIRFPEYGRPGEDARHRRRMTTALDVAAALIANSAETARDLSAFAAELGRPAPEIVVAPLGLETGFAREVPAMTAATPYFVALGTIEPRKNHLLLLHLWRRLAERLGDETPTLVVVGRRGWENEMIVDLLERSPAIRRHVIEANDLPDAALAALVKGARALLFPSFAEGYGLPLAEAMALGAPVIASDLPAFREIAGDRIETLDPLDGRAWEEAVLAFAQAPSTRRDAAILRARGFEPPSWHDHFRIVGAAVGLG